MQTTVELPESIYRRTEEAARARGVGIDELISEMLERELANEAQPVMTPHRVSLPIIHSRNAGTLDLSNTEELRASRRKRRVSFPVLSSNELGTLDLSDFDFDDLLA